MAELTSRQPLKALIDVGATAESRPVDRTARPDQAELDLLLANVAEEQVDDQEVLETRPADGTAALPDGVALLCVAHGNDGGPGRGTKVTMSWHHGTRTLEAHDRTISVDSDGMNRSIAHIMHVAQHPAEDPTPPRNPKFGGPWHIAYLRATDRWAGLPDLGGWISALRTSARDAAHLVIWDVSGEDIPWELYHGRVGTDERGQAELGWLGVTVPISRWIGGHPRPESYPARRHQAVGGVLLFDDGQTHKVDEYKNTYNAAKHVRVGDLEDRMENLLDRLEGDENFGLLLIRGEGEYDTNAEAFALAGLPLIFLNELELRALGRNRPAVLLGVCSSARTFVQDRALNRPVRSFVERFLSRGASSVIAVLAEVDITHLTGLADRLIHDAQADPVVLARWLQHHRKKYLDLLKQQRGACAQDKEDWYRMFLTSSLFVCYGHPLTTLHLCAATDTNADAAPDSETGDTP